MGVVIAGVTLVAVVAVVTVVAVSIWVDRIVD
jgi:hypothetical protein